MQEEQTSNLRAPEEKLRCAFCREEVEGKPIRKSQRLYCSEACAFEGQRPCRCNPDLIVYHGSGRS